jgi:metal-sulfur cluster biosynthetic enzyme
MLKKEDAIGALQKIKDPEIGLDIWTLGFIYDIAIDKDKVHIKMTLTTPFCPMAQHMMLEVKKGLTEIGFKNPEVELVFDPPWEPSKEVKTLMGW